MPCAFVYGMAGHRENDLVQHLEARRHARLCRGVRHVPLPRQERRWPVNHWGLARPNFSTSAFSRVKVSCANFLYSDVLMYMGTMS